MAFLEWELPFDAKTERILGPMDAALHPDLEHCRTIATVGT